MRLRPGAHWGQELMEVAMLSVWKTPAVPGATLTAPSQTHSASPLAYGLNALWRGRPTGAAEIRAERASLTEHRTSLGSG